MLNITELRKDALIQIGADPYRVLEYQHKKVGRGGAIVRLKIRNLRSGSIQTKTFRGNEKVEPAEVTKRDAQYLYNDGSNLWLMDLKTYDQTQVNLKLIGPRSKFLKDGMEVVAVGFGGQIIDLELPKNLALKVAQTEPGVRGDTATAALKTCILETGAKVQVPLFIKAGDTIKIDSLTGQYIGRA